MILAFMEASAEHAVARGGGISLPICERVAPCKACSQHKCKITKLECRIKELESRNVIELAARKLVEEARGNVKDAEWPSAKRRLSLLFRPDQLYCCPRLLEHAFSKPCDIVEVELCNVIHCSNLSPPNSEMKYNDLG